MKKNSIRIIVIFLCLISAYLAFRGSLDIVVNKIGIQSLITHNDEYLNMSFNKALVGFGVMSALKAGLDIIEGSEIGASFGITAQVEVGDIVRPAYDYIDIAWRTLLTSCVTLLSIRYLLKAATIIDGYMLGATLIIVAIFLMLRWWLPAWSYAKGVVRDVLSVAIVATLAIYYILPLSVWGASRLSSLITRPAIEEAQKGFEETKNTLFPDNQQTTDGIVAKLKQLPSRIQQIANYLKNKTMDMVVWSIKLITGYIFDCIVFPLTLFILMLWMTRSIMWYIFHKNLQSSIRDDISRILAGKESAKTD